MFGLVMQFLSIVVFGDFNPVFTPGLDEDAAILEVAYNLMGLFN